VVDENKQRLEKRTTKFKGVFAMRNLTIKRSVLVVVLGLILAGLSVSFTGVGEGGSSPEISSVEFREWILAYGQAVEGRVGFKDPDGDIVRAEFTVVEAEDFEPFSFDPKVEGQTEGEFTLSLSTRVVQEVTLELVLIDREGNRSDPWRFSFSAREADIVVPRDYGTIQEAIDAAEEGDVIYVKAGTYRENIEIVEKSLELQGAGRGRTHIKAAEENESVIEIYADRSRRPVHVEGVSISGAYGSCDCSGGYYEDYIHNIGCSHGIAIQGTVSAEILNCAVFENRCDGVIAQTWPADPDLPVWGVVVTNCKIYKNGAAGIYGIEESALKVAESAISENSNGGIMLRNEALATISDSSISANGYDGVQLQESAKAVISKSTVTGNADNGIELQDSAKATITGSTISENPYGIRLWSSVEAEISNNSIDGNTYGIYSESSGEVKGEGNIFSGNGAALCGNLPGSLRIPLTEATEDEIVYPDEEYSSLQEAVDALLPGGRLVLQAGEYELDSAVVIDKEMQLESKGGVGTPEERRVTLKNTRRVYVPRSGISTAHYASVVPVFSLVGGAKLGLVGVEITGSTSGLLLGANAYAKSTSSTFSENNTGVKLLGSAQTTITNSSFSGNSTGVRLYGTAQATITGSTFSNNSRGIWIRGSAQAAITDSSFSLSAGYVFSSQLSGIRLENSAQATITDSTFSRTGYAVELQNNSQAIITGSTFSNNSRGIALTSWSEGGYKGLAQAAITDSSFFENTYGIWLTGTAQATITGSTFAKNRECGVRLGGEKERSWGSGKIPSTAQATITNCKFTESSILLLNSTQVKVSNSTFEGRGIALSGPTKAEITESTISGSVNGIFLSEGAYAQISNSTISENEDTGIYIFSARAQITDSTISRNGCTGILVKFGSGLEITGSSISDNGCTGIYLFLEARAEITDSTISGNNGDGVYSRCWCGLDRVTLTASGNRIINNERYGVGLECREEDTGRGCCHVSGKSNSIYGNRKGTVYPSDLRFLTTSAGGELRYP